MILGIFISGKKLKIFLHFSYLLKKYKFETHHFIYQD